MKTCLHCGQPMRERRLGIFMSDRMVSIVDALQKAPDGLSSDILLMRLGIKNRNTLKAYIYLLNMLLAETDYRIVHWDRAYHLTKSLHTIHS